MLALIVTIALSYLLGSLSSAVLVAKLLRLPDPREHGSKNPGATNMLRLGGKKAGALTFLGDCLKGFLPALVFGYVFTDAYAIVFGTIAGVAAMLGHCYPVFMGFKGGKGVATYVGMLLAVSPWLLLVFAVVWLSLVLLTRYVSLASMLGGIAVMVASFFFLNQLSVTGLFLFLSVLLVFRHRDNLTRLIDGNENKVSLPTR